MKKIIKSLFCCTCVLAIIGVVLAASSTTFYVNGVKITGKVSYTDTSPYNPLSYDSVTAKTTSAAAMDSIQAKATITYWVGSTKYTKSKSKTNPSTNSASITVKAEHSNGVASKGEGYHYASHNGLSGYGNTNILFN